MTKHIHLDWSVDWKEKTIGGSVQHTMRALEATSVAIFDSSYLTIKDVTTASGTPLNFDLPPRHKVMGSALKVTLPRELKKGETIDVVISYETTKECTALGWLKPEQTASGLYPFLFSQCQVSSVFRPLGAEFRSGRSSSPPFAGHSLPLSRPYVLSLRPLQAPTRATRLTLGSILAHSALHLLTSSPSLSRIACQDTPAIKSTYSASVTSPLPILMSALGISPSREETSSQEIDPKVSKIYTFEQKIPIPSYLIAIAGGEVAFAVSRADGA